MATSARPRLAPAELPGRPDAEAELARRFYAGRRSHAAILHLDRWSQVESHFGAQAGARLLEAVATHLEEWMQPSDRLYRWSGATLLLVVDRDTRSAATAASLRRHLAAIPPLTLGPAVLRIGCSTALFALDDSPSPALLARRIELHLGTAVPGC
jgi:GGDEF domain-containing protein